MLNRNVWFTAMMLFAVSSVQARDLDKPLPLEKDHIENGYCSPQLDDDCYLNNQKVDKAELGKYLPDVKVEDIEQSGGYCEYPICYSHDDKPIGVRQ